MPTVPLYREPQVEAAPLRGGELSDASAGARAGNNGRAVSQLGAGLTNFGNSMDSIAVKEANRQLFDNEAKVKDAWLAYSSELQKNRRGAGAAGVAAEAEKWWQEQAPKLIGGATNSMATNMLQQSLKKQSLAALGEFQNYEAKQLDIAGTEAYAHSVTSAANLAAAAPTPGNVKTQIDNVRAAVARRAAERGWNTTGDAQARKIYDGELQGALSTVHEAVFNKLFVQSPMEAKAYYEANKGEIVGTKHDNIEARLKVGVASTMGDTVAQDLWLEGGPKKDIDPVELDKLEAKARERLKGDPEAMKSAISGLRERAVAHNNSQSERAVANTNGALDVFKNTGSVAAVRRSAAYAALPPAKRLELDTLMDNRISSQLARDEQVQARHERQLQRNGAGAYLALSNPKVLAGMSEAQISALLPQLGVQYTTDLMNKRRALNTSLDRQSAQIDHDMFVSIALDMGLRPNEPNKSEAEKDRLAIIKGRVEEMIDVAQKRKGAPLTPMEKSELMRAEVAKRIKRPGSWLGDEVPIIGLTEKEKQEIHIPPEDRRVLLDQMRRRYETSGDSAYEPKEANLRRLYLEKLRRTPAVEK